MTAPLGWQEVVIDEVRRCTPRVVSVSLRLQLPGQLAGQHLELRLTAPDGYQAQRSYSIASAPGAARVELLIERLDDGEVSPWFHDVATAGDAIEARGPIGGHFVWRPADGGPLLLVGGGSGVVPLLAMLRQRRAAGSDAPALLVCSARTHDELIAADELHAMEAADPAFRWLVVTTREARRRERDQERRIDAAMLQQALADWGEVPREAFVCGATPFVEAVADGLRHNGVPAHAIRTERYGGA